MKGSSRSISIIFSLLLFAIAFSVGRAEIPRLFLQREFSAADLAQAVNFFVALGEENAVSELTKLAPNYDSRFGEFNRSFNRTERVGWVCRILFVPKGKDPIRPPMYGGLMLPFETMPYTSWPLYPIAASGKTFFVLSEGYRLAGEPEEPTRYLAHCRAEGVFRKQPVPVPTQAEAQRDALTLRQSPVWKTIKWKDSGQGFSYTMSEELAWKFIQAQADTIR